MKYTCFFFHFPSLTDWRHLSTSTWCSIKQGWDRHNGTSDLFYVLIRSGHFSNIYVFLGTLSLPVDQFKVCGKSKSKGNDHNSNHHLGRNFY